MGSVSAGSDGVGLFGGVDFALKRGEQQWQLAVASHRLDIVPPYTVSACDLIDVDVGPQRL
jgi:hypothetical protein